MSSSDGGGAMSSLDPRMQQFIHQETQKQKLQETLQTIVSGNVIHELNEKCWDQCMSTAKLSSRLDTKSEGCLRNCVERFLDANILVTQRLDKKADDILRQHDNLGGELH